MKPLTPTIWNTLHDGCIERINGTVPGDLRLYVSIEYLRTRFQDQGDAIVVTLANCTLFEYRNYDAKHLVTDLESIASECPSILSAEMKGALCQIFSDAGVLEVKCDGIAISLDSGRNVSLEELIATAGAYWEQWRTSSKRSD